MSNLFEELKRRSVFKVGVAYAVVGWVVVQAAEIGLPAFGADAWLRTVIIVVAIGFPITLVLAWIYELTPEGIKTDKVAKKNPHKDKGGLNKVIAGALVLALGFIGYQQVYAPSQRTSSTGKGYEEYSIAVLPFADLSEARDQEYFGDGVAEEILNLLAQLDDLRVTSRSSSFSLKGQNLDVPTMGRKLGVNHILEGSIRRDGSQVRITAQLIEVETDAHLWSENYDRDVTDIFAVQDEIALAIVDALKIELGDSKMDMASTGAANIDAYELYLLGKHNMARRIRVDLEAARSYFEQAVAADPTFAPARAGLAQSIILLGDRHYGDSTIDEISAMALPELEAALELEPDLAEAHGAYGLYYMTVLDFPQSMTALEKALDLNPNYAEAWTWASSVYSGTFQFEKALVALEKGYMLDPLSLLGRNNYGNYNIYLGDFEKAEEISNSVIQDFPDHPFGYASLASLYRVQGRLSEALQAALTGMEQDPVIGGNNTLVEAILSDFKSVELSEQILGTVSPMVSIAAKDVDMTLDRFRSVTPWADLTMPEQAGAANFLIGFGDHDGAFDLLNPIFGDGYYNNSAILDPVMEGLGTTAYAWLLRERGQQEAFEKMLIVIRSRLELFQSGGSFPDFAYGYVRLLVLDGKNDEAISELSALVDSGFRGWYAGDDFVLEPLFDDPRFQDVIARLDAAVAVERQKAEAFLNNDQ